MGLLQVPKGLVLRKRLHSCLQGFSSCLVGKSGRAFRQHLGLVGRAEVVSIRSAGSGEGYAGWGDGGIDPGMEGYAVLQMKDGMTVD